MVLHPWTWNCVAIVVLHLWYCNSCIAIVGVAIVGVAIVGLAIVGLATVGVAIVGLAIVQ